MSITTGADGNLWFVENGASQIARLTPTGTFTEFPVTQRPWDICKGPDGNVWFTEYNPQDNTGFLGRITPSGVVTEYASPSYPLGLTTGPDKNIWFTEPSPGKIGRFITP